MSHTTVHHALRGPRLPRWETTRAIVDALGGSIDHFHELWTDAKIQVQGGASGADAVAPQPEHRNPLRPAAPRDHVGEAYDRPPSAPEYSAPHQATDQFGTLVAPDEGWADLFGRPGAPPIIQLMKAALDNQRDPLRQFFEVARVDPAGAAPAIVMLADYDPTRTAEAIADLAHPDHDRVSALLTEVVAARPERAATIIELLFTKYDVHPTALAAASVTLAHAVPARRDLAARILAAAVTLRDTDRLITKLITLVRAERGFGAVSAACRQLMTRPETRPSGAELLAWIARTDLPVGVEIFLDLAFARGDHDGGRVRRAVDHRTLLGVIAEHYPRGCPVLLLAGILGHAYTGRTPTASDVGRALAALAEEDLPRCAQLIRAVIVRDPRNLARMLPVLASIPQAELTAPILLSLSRTDLDVAARLLARWSASYYPEIPEPPGRVVSFMVARDVRRTADILRRVAEFEPQPQAAGMLLSGLDKNERKTLTAELYEYLSYEEWTRVSPLLMPRKRTFLDTVDNTFQV